MDIVHPAFSLPTTALRILQDAPNDDNNNNNNNNDNNNGWFLYSANLPVKKTQCASTHHSCTYTHRHKHNLRLPTHIMVCLDLWNCLLKKESFELGFEVREGGEIPQAIRQRIPDSWGNESERTVANRFEIEFMDFKSFSCYDRRVHEV